MTKSIQHLHPVYLTNNDTGPLEQPFCIRCFPKPAITEPAHTGVIKAILINQPKKEEKTILFHA